MIRVFIMLFLGLAFSYNLFSQTTDYSSYEIAKKYRKENNFVLAYKHLIIFKFSNIDKLNEPKNAETLTKLEKQISEVEDYLKQNIAWYEIKKSRGFSDKKLDSLFKNQATEIQLESIKIN